MQLTFLGTSAGMPTVTRNVSSLGLQWMQQGALWLFDCGEATQHQILRSPLKLSHLENIFITHLHGDHVFGLPGLLASRSQVKDLQTTVTVYGPSGLEEFLRAALLLTHTHLGYPLRVQTVEPGLIFEDETRLVYCDRLAHRVETFGYAVVEKPKRGEFDVAKAQELGVPEGPLYGRLKNGGAVTLSDGRIVEGRELVGPERPGRKVVVCGDTGVTPAVAELAANADVLVHEATFLNEQAERAKESGHSTAAQAATSAKEAEVQALILTHFSARYETHDGTRMAELLAEAQAIFPNTLLAHDFWSYTVPPYQSL